MSDQEEDGSEKVPTHHPAAELAVLGSMMVERQAAVAVSKVLKPLDFYNEVNQVIYKGALAVLADAAAPVPDLPILAEKLRFIGKLDEVGGTRYLAGLTKAVSSAAHATYYANLVRRASLDRQIQAEIVRTAAEPTRDAIKRLGGLIQAREGLAAYEILDFQEDLHDAIESLVARLPEGFKLGFADIDEAIVGARPGDVVTIGARTNGGKTAFKVKVAANLALAGISVAYMSTEMDKYSLFFRILPMLSGVPASHFQRRQLGADDWTAITKAGERMGQMPFKLMSKPRLSLQDIRAVTVATGAKVVFVDYLQRCVFPKAENRAYAIGEFMAELQSFAQEAQVVVVIGCQLDRGLDREQRPPTMADLKDSGGIEAESAQVILLWKPPSKRLEGPAPDEGCVPFEAIVAKSRWGHAPQVAQLQMRKDVIEFCERAERKAEKQEAFTW